jgi:hypothetical protein
MCHLAHGMDARIGAPRALNFYVSSEQILNSELQLALYRAGVDLLLPSGVARAVVFKNQSKCLHKGFFYPGKARSATRGK